MDIILHHLHHLHTWHGPRPPAMRTGFVTVDDTGVPCAGFRQCGSSKGTTGLNPAAHSWDVPMEIRCAENRSVQ